MIKIINKHDIVMMMMVPIMYTLQIWSRVYLNTELFTIYHVMLLSACYGGYITLRLFTSLQKRLALKKGLSKELDEINRLEKKDKNDRPRWIK